MEIKAKKHSKVLVSSLERDLPKGVQNLEGKVVIAELQHYLFKYVGISITYGCRGFLL